MKGFYQLFPIDPSKLPKDQRKLADRIDEICSTEGSGAILQAWLFCTDFQKDFLEWFRPLQKAFDEYSGKNCTIYTFDVGPSIAKKNYNICINIARMMKIDEECFPCLAFFERFNDTTPLTIVSFKEITTEDDLRQVLCEIGTVIYKSTCNNAFDKKGFIKSIRCIEKKIKKKIFMGQLAMLQPIVSYFADGLKQAYLSTLNR